MEFEPLVSVIVPVYKAEQYLRTCVDSVLEQSYNKIELILIDDGSPDECPLICDAYKQKDSRVRVYHYENGGQALARNRALDIPPKGDYITFIDSDDFWHRDYLKILLELCEKESADIVQCAFIRGTDSLFPKLDESIKVRVFDNHTIFLSEQANVILCGKLFKSSLFQEIRMPVGLYNEDDWTAWKLYYKAQRIVVTSQALYYYTFNPNSTMANMQKKPDFRYWGAYDERISFFIGEGEKDLEDCSRLQFCKSLISSFSNNRLTERDRESIKKRFNENWPFLHKSPYIKRIYKVLFCLFYFAPYLTSRMVNIIR